MRMGKRAQNMDRKAVVQRNKWLTQKAMAQLFGVQVSAINKHLENIFSEGELIEEVVISKMETVVILYWIFG